MAKRGTLLRPLNIGKRQTHSKYAKHFLPKFFTYPIDKDKYVIAKSGALRKFDKPNTDKTNAGERV